MELHGGFNNFDYLVLGVILLSGLLALMRGLVRELFSLVAWAGAYLAATHYYPLAEPWAKRLIAKQDYIPYVAGAIVFILAFIVLSLMGALIAKLVRGNALTAIDRSLGFVFGILRGALVVSMLYLIATTVMWTDNEAPKANPDQAQNAAPNAEEKDTVKGPTAPEWVLKAKTRPFLDYGAHVLQDFIPDKTFEKTTHNVPGTKAAAEKIIDKKAEDVLSIPHNP